MLRFTETIGSQCANQKCERFRQRVGDESSKCARCGQQLVPKEALNWRLLAPAAFLLILILAGVAVGVRSLLEWRAQSKERELLDRATARFQASLQGATVSDVSTVAAAVKTEFQLSEEQRGRMLERSQDRIDALPRELTPETERQLERLFRDGYRDGVVSPRERQEIERAARDGRLAPASVKTVEQRVQSLTSEARHSIERSRALVGEKHYEEARQELQRAVDANPDDPILWANLGAVHAAAGRMEEARFCYNRALRLDPHLWLAHYNLGLLEERGGNRASAIQHLESALANLGSDSPGERAAVIENLLSEPGLAGLRADTRFSRILSATGSSRGQG